MSFSTEGAENDIQKGTFNPSMLGSIEDAKYVGRETINGIPTKHYKYNSKTGMLAALGEVSGETWVAIDGGYVVKDTVKWTGGGGLLGLGCVHHGHRRRDPGPGNSRTSTNRSKSSRRKVARGQNLTCRSCRMPSEKSRFGDMTTYKTAGKPADVATFYKEELAAAGWKPEGEPTEMGDVVMLNFAKDDQKLSVMITASDGATQVILTVSK